LRMHPCSLAAKHPAEAGCSRWGGSGKHPSLGGYSPPQKAVVGEDGAEVRAFADVAEVDASVVSHGATAI
jgi:hypothetical protein